MADLLAKGSAWLSEKLKQHASQTVEYVQGDVTLQVQATIGATRVEVDDSGGTIINVQVRDYLIDVADLVNDIEQLEPLQGDQIRETDGTLIHVYEVAPIGAEKCWRYSDPHRIKYRIHTKHAGTES